jgi:hypothetical protein
LPLVRGDEERAGPASDIDDSFVRLQFSEVEEDSLNRCSPLVTRTR